MAKKSRGSHHKKIVLKPTYKVENLVASADLKLDLDLYGLANLSRDIDYEPEQFPGAILKVHEPKAALLLFKNGKIICTGAKTETDVKRAVGEAVELVKRFRHLHKSKLKASAR
jgi:transcription initiation factor TFIID TATA-box-binding protein